VRGGRPEPRRIRNPLARDHRAALASLRFCALARSIGFERRLHGQPLLRRPRRRQKRRPLPRRPHGNRAPPTARPRQAIAFPPARGVEYRFLELLLLSMSLNQDRDNHMVTSMI